MKFEFEAGSIGEISDGYHSFEELYHHRTILFSIICNTYKKRAWKSWFHANGTHIEGYFIAGITTPDGEYSYHCKVVYWSSFHVKELNRAPAWDGHAPGDVERLYSLLDQEAKPNSENR